VIPNANTTAAVAKIYMGVNSLKSNTMTFREMAIKVVATTSLAGNTSKGLYW